MGVIRLRPSSAKHTPKKPPRPELFVSSFSPVDASQTIITPTSSADTSRLPSGLQSTP
jgi:hypothetical protein